MAFWRCMVLRRPNFRRSGQEMTMAEDGDTSAEGDCSMAACLKNSHPWGQVLPDCLTPRKEQNRQILFVEWAGDIGGRQGTES
jgi:hypothetical protein